MASLSYSLSTIVTVLKMQNKGLCKEANKHQPKSTAKLYLSDTIYQHK